MAVKVAHIKIVAIVVPTMITEMETLVAVFLAGEATNTTMENVTPKRVPIDEKFKERLQWTKL